MEEGRVEAEGPWRAGKVPVKSDCWSWLAENVPEGRRAVLRDRHLGRQAKRIEKPSQEGRKAFVGPVTTPSVPNGE